MKILIEVRTPNADVISINRNIDLDNDIILQSFIVENSVIINDISNATQSLTQILIQEQPVYRLLNLTNSMHRHPYMLVRLEQDEIDTNISKLKCVWNDGRTETFDSFIILNNVCYPVINGKVDDSIIMSIVKSSMSVSIETKQLSIDTSSITDYYIHAILTKKDNNTIVMMRRPAYCIIDKHNCASYSKDNDIISQYAINTSHVVTLVSSHGIHNSILHIKSEQNLLVIANADQIIIADHMVKAYHNDLVICEYNLLDSTTKLTVTVVDNKY